MKRFAFALEKVLEYRTQVESDRKRALGLAAEVFRKREDDLRALASRMETYTTRLAQMGVGRISPRQLALYRSYLTYLEAEVEKAAQWLHDAAVRLEERRQELLASTKDRKVLEKVKGRKRAEHDYQAGREETSRLDEVGVTKFLADGSVSRAEEGK